jgi:hypothetical protein
VKKTSNYYSFPLIRSCGLIAFLQIFFSFNLHASTGTGVSGFWNQNATWNFGGTNRLPSCGDTLLIPANVTITVNSQEDYSICGQPMLIVIDGTLQFALGDKISLPCASSIKLLANGSVRKFGTGAGNSSYIHICNCIAWQAADGDVTGPGNLNCSVLPVSFVNFNAKQKENSIELFWSTATELNNDFFSVERSVTNEDFKSIAIIKGSGNSSSQIDYSFEDHDKFSGIIYYRLKQVDFDGTSTNSNIIAIKSILEKKLNIVTSYTGDGSPAFKIYNSSSDLSINIYSVSGQKIYSTILNPGSDLTPFTIPFSITKGQYVIFCSNGVELVNSKFTVN